MRSSISSPSATTGKLCGLVPLIAGLSALAVAAAICQAPAGAFFASTHNSCQAMKDVVIHVLEDGWSPAGLGESRKELFADEEGWKRFQAFTNRTRDVLTKRQVAAVKVVPGNNLDCQQIDGATRVLGRLTAVLTSNTAIDTKPLMISAEFVSGNRLKRIQVNPASAQETSVGGKEKARD